MDKIAVLIPCYNEAKTVEKVVTDFRRVLPEATIYVYDNNSTDGTAELAAAAGAVVRHEYQQGKGNVMRRMFREIDAEAYVLVDGDDTYPAEAAPEMVRAVTQRQADMVVGDRLSSTYYTQNKRPFHNFGNDLVRFCTNHLFGGKIKDIMTGYRAFSYQFVKTYPVLSRGFEIETEMTIHALQRNMQVDNVVIEYRDRPEGSESKLNTYSDGFKVLGTILRLFKNYRPFTFFGVLAAVLAVFGIGFMIPVLNEYFHTGLVPRFPTLIVCCFVLVAALLLFVSGVILSSQLAKDARDFEFQLQTVQHWKRTAGAMNATARTRAFLKTIRCSGRSSLVELLFLAALVAGGLSAHWRKSRCRWTAGPGRRTAAAVSQTVTCRPADTGSRCSMRRPIRRTPSAPTTGRWPPCPSPRPKTRRRCKAIPSPSPATCSHGHSPAVGRHGRHGGRPDTDGARPRRRGSSFPCRA